MANIFHEDFRDFINALNEAEVRYILVGGYSVVLHGYSRITGDMDLWMERTSENYKRITKAFRIFGMPLFDMTESNFLSHPIWDVFTFGTPPVAIDIMVNIEGLNFEDVFQKAVYFEDDDLKIRTINRNDLIAAKKIAGRAKDINDLENLE
jgi:predicted nucleotidyltransferase